MQLPSLSIQADSSLPSAESGQWLVTWIIQNTSGSPIEVSSAWLPHDKFFRKEQPITPPLRLSPGENTHLELMVSCGELPGTVVDNAFLILRLVWEEQPWRAFARHRVTLCQTGVPRPECLAVSVHPVGFAAGSGPGGPRPD